MSPLKGLLIRYDQQANLQCNATLAKEHTRSPAIPRGMPRRSQTGVGEDHWPTRTYEPASREREERARIRYDLQEGEN